MIGVPMGDHDDIDGIEPRRIGHEAVALQWAESVAQEGIGQDAEPAEVEQDSGVTKEPQVERRNADGCPRVVSGRRRDPRES